MKKLFQLLSILSLILLNLVCIFSFPILQTKPISSTLDYGKIVVTTLESDTGKPIDNATVCIIETREYYSTNKNGLTDLIKVPIIKNEHFNNTLERTWGEITILVYKPGYNDHISFYEEVKSNHTRLGIIVRLSPIYNAKDNTPTITSNAPNSEYVKKLISLYKK